MPQRAATFARRPSGTRAAERARSMGESAGAAVPLDIRPLLAPYKRHRGLSIRIERLLHGARLTHGRNNGDRSWSLFPDDLDGLEYLPATAAYEAHTLAVRIISLDGGDGETLTVLDLAIPGVAPAPAPVAEASLQDPSTAAEVAQLREELASAKLLLEARNAELSKATESLAARETELANTHRRADEVQRSGGSAKSELEIARQAWEVQLHQRLSAAEADHKAALEKARADWQAEQGSRLIRSEAGAHRAIEDVRRRGKEELDAALSQARSDWKASEAVRFSAAEAVWRDDASRTAADLRNRAEAAEKALAEAIAVSKVARSTDTDDLRRRAQEELDAALSQARSDWKASEAARFAAAEAVWRDEASKTAADLRKKVESAEKARAEATAALNAARNSEAEELRQLREQLAQALANLANRGAELAEARAATDLAKKAMRDSASELRRAEQEWKIAEAARLADSEAQWKERSGQIVAEINARLDTAESALVEARAQAEARLHQTSIVQAALDARESELEQLRSVSEQARLQLSSEADSAARRQREMEAQLTKAQNEWKSAEAERFAAAEAQWKAQVDAAGTGSTKELQDAQGALVQAHVELQMLRDSSHREIRQLRDDVAAAQISLSARESELAGMRAIAEPARTTASQSSEGVAAQIEMAREKWKLEADAALASAEAAWRAEEASRIAAADAKLQEAVPGYNEIAEKLQGAEAALAGSKACADALRHELNAAQTSLSHREFELAEARELFERECERLKHVPISTHENKPRWEVDEEERRWHFRKRLIRDFAIVSCLAGLAFVAYPRVQPVVADAWPQELSFQGRVQPWLQMAGLAKLPPAPPVLEPHAIVAVRVANLRTEPSSGAHLVTKLTRNMEVTTVERRGKWVFVRVSDGATQKQGWVVSSVLKDEQVAAATTSRRD